MTLITQNGSAIAAVFAQSWGPAKLDLSPWDSPKGLCNLGQVSGVEYWGRTSAQRYLDVIYDIDNGILPVYNVIERFYD